MQNNRRELRQRTAQKGKTINTIKERYIKIVSFFAKKLLMKTLSFLFAIAATVSLYSCQPNDTTQCLPPPPPIISGPTTVSVGGTITLSVTATGGTWSSSSPENATINSSGVLTGIAPGGTLIRYTTPGSCSISSAGYAVMVQ